MSRNERRELRRLVNAGKKLDRPLYPASLKGLSHTQLGRQRGLRGGTYGPASEVRHIDPKTGQVSKPIEKLPWEE